MVVLVLSHYDADGYCSAFLLKEWLRSQGEDVVVGIVKMPGFGVPEDPSGVVFEREWGLDAVDRVYVLDLGSTRENVENVRKWFGEKKPRVILVDHHERELTDEDVEKLMEEGFEFYHDLGGCTTSLVFMYIYNRDPEFLSDHYYMMIALAGAFGDVQVDARKLQGYDGYPITQNMVDIILSSGYVPRNYMFNGRFYPDFMMVSAYLNSIRRMLVGVDGAEMLGLRYLDEMRELKYFPDDSDFQSKMWLLLRYPGVYAVMDAYREWLRFRQRLTEGACTVYEEVLPGLVIAVIRSRYDVGGYYASYLHGSVYNNWMRSDMLENVVPAVVRDKRLREHVANLLTGLVIVYNETLGVVSLRGEVPFMRVCEIARKYFNGGGHERGAGAGSFEGSYIEFVEYVKAKIYPAIARGVEYARKHFAEYVRWLQGQGEFKTLKEIEDALSAEEQAEALALGGS